MTITSLASPPDVLHWGDQFLLGYTPMDDVHEVFVTLIEQLQCAEDPALSGLLAQLASHLKQHFEMENDWMRETAFPPRDCHIDEHAAVMQSVLEVQGLLAQGHVAICRELVDELAAWFPRHADHLDSALAHWMTKRSLGGKPVVVRRGLTLR